VNYSSRWTESSSENFSLISACWSLMHHDLKISGSRILTHDLWIRKRVYYTTTPNACYITVTCDAIAASIHCWIATWTRVFTVELLHEHEYSFLRTVVPSPNSLLNKINSLPDLIFFLRYLVHFFVHDPVLNWYSYLWSRWSRLLPRSRWRDWWTWPLCIRGLTRRNSMYGFL